MYLFCLKYSLDNCFFFVVAVEEKAQLQMSLVLKSDVLFFQNVLEFLRHLNKDLFLICYRTEKILKRCIPSSTESY